MNLVKYIIHQFFYFNLPIISLYFQFKYILCYARGYEFSYKAANGATKLFLICLRIIKNASLLQQLSNTKIRPNLMWHYSDYK